MNFNFWKAATAAFAVLPAGLAFGLSVGSVQALSLKKITRDIGNIGRQVARLPNPITTPVQIVTGHQNPLHVGEYIKQQGQAVGSLTNSVRDLSNLPNDAAGRAIAQIGGDKAKIVFEVATGGERLQREFAFTAANAAGNILAGQDPLISLAMPLAAAIRDARAKFINDAKKLPDAVRLALGPIIPSEVLERARYVVGDIKISLPTAIIEGGKMFGSDLAVTVDDVIVFPRELNFEDTDDLAWVAHESFHVKQYRDWGVDQFAFNYLKNHRAVEDQAIAAQSYAKSYLDQIANDRPIQPTITYVGATSFVAKNIETPLGTTSVFVATPNNASNPGAPPQGGVLQPVYQNAIRRDLSAYCLLNGESLFIAKDDTIIAPMRGSVSFGRRYKPGLSPQCYFDLQFPAARACAVEVASRDPASGVTMYGYEVYLGAMHMGRCVSCTPELCPS